MKRVLISTFILLSVFFISFLTTKAITKELTHLKSELINCIEVTDKNAVELTKTEFEEIYKSWQITAKKLELIISEDLCSEVSNELEAAAVNLNSKDYSEANNNIKRAVNTINKIIDREKLSLDAIL